MFLMTLCGDNASDIDRTHMFTHKDLSNDYLWGSQINIIVMNSIRFYQHDSLFSY